MGKFKEKDILLKARVSRRMYLALCNSPAWRMADYGMIHDYAEKLAKLRFHPIRKLNRNIA